MKSLLNAEDVLSDIEFELVQGAISQEDLGRGIRAVRRHQDKVRREILEASRRSRYDREVITQLFQINGMLITLAQEMTAAIQSLRVDLRKVARMSQSISRAARAGDSATEKDSSASGVVEEQAYNEVDGNPDWQAPPEVEDAMRPEALQGEMDVRPVNIPVVGGLLQRLRVAMHRLVWFYVDRLAGKQVLVNQAYGDWILRLIQIHEYQQKQIDLLNTRLRSLEDHLVKNGE